MFKFSKVSEPSKDMKQHLADAVGVLKDSHPFYKRKLKLYEIEKATGIPIGTMGYQIRYKKLSDINYKKLLKYIQELQSTLQQMEGEKEIATTV